MFYDFKCQKCGKVTERRFSISECPASIVCECGGEAIKAISAPSIKIGGVFKGGGSSFGNAVRKMNDGAASRMRGRGDAPKLCALDYGGGRVEEVK